MIDPFAFSGLPVIVSPHASREVSNHRLGEWSRDPYVDKAVIARIQAWCDSVFGTHWEDCAYLIDLDGQRRLVVGPSIAAQLRKAPSQNSEEKP